MRIILGIIVVLLIAGGLGADQVEDQQIQDKCKVRIADYYANQKTFVFDDTTFDVKHSNSGPNFWSSIEADYTSPSGRTARGLFACDLRPKFNQAGRETYYYRIVHWKDIDTTEGN